MYMSYTSNPHLPKLRMDAVRMVRQGQSIRSVARYWGYQPSTIMRWVRKADRVDTFQRVVPTASSRPKSHPAQLSEEVVRAIVDCRSKYHRGAEFIHFLLERDGVEVSLSSVKRTLKREGLIYPSKWKKWHSYPPRPLPAYPGDLVEVDTIFDGVPERRLYIYTTLDICSRWAYARPAMKINTHSSLGFVTAAQAAAPFKFTTIQSDHGPEFSKWFSKRVGEAGLAHRHSRVRTPNDNAHLERFNRTIQEECIYRLPRKLEVWQKEIPEYLKWYNEGRPHMGINMQTPSQVLLSY